MSVLTYNGVVLPYSYCTSFLQRPLYEESGTDWYATEYDISVQTIICSDYLSMLTPGMADEGVTNPAVIMKAIRNKLMQTRRPISFTFEGTELLPQNSMPGTVDARNGPMPQACDLVQLTNTSYLMNFHIVARYWEGTPTSKAATQCSDVLYNRWAESVDIDSRNFTTRTREGKYSIRSDNSRGDVADEYRSDMAVLGVPVGFIRQSSHYTQSPDGLTIAYRITDKEVYKLPPEPAYEAEGEYTESLSRNGARKTCDVRVRLQGGPMTSTSQATMLQRAINVATTKLAIVGAPILGKKRHILMSASVTVGMYDNYVEAKLQALGNVLTTPDGKGRVYGVPAIEWNTICLTPGSEPGDNPKSPVYPDYGSRSASVLLRAASYFDPSLRNIALDPKTGQVVTTQSLAPGQAGLTRET